MFGVSIPEILLVCVIILIVLGPERLPEASRTVARLLGQFRRQADSVRREIYNSMYVPAEEFRNDFDEVRQNLKAVKDEVSSILPSTPEELLTCEDKARLEEERRKKEEAKKNQLEASEPTGETSDE